MRKKIVIGWIGIFILLAMSSFVAAIEQDLTGINGTPRYERNYPYLRVEQLKYEPYPVTPGEYFNFWVKIKNAGDDDAEKVKIMLDSEYPFSADFDYEKEYDKINAYGEVLIKFRVRTDEDAVEGINKIHVKTKIGSAYWVDHELNIEVRSLDLLLDITNISVEMLEPGKINSMKMTLANNGVSLIRDINIELDIDSSSIPIVPVYSSSKKKIYHLPGGMSEELSFDLMAETDASSEIYKVPIFVTYYDEAGTRYVKNETIGLLVGSKPEIEVNVEESEVFTKKSKGKVTIAISNTGTSDIKFLSAELLEDSKYKILSAVKRSYLGNLESDDFETVSYDIYTNAGYKDSEIMLKVLLDYKDAFNNEASEVVEVPLKVFSSSEASRYGLKPSSSMFSYLVMLVIVIVIYQVVRDWRKTKDINKSLKKVVKEDVDWSVHIIKKIKWRNIKRIPRKIKIFLKTR